MPSDAKPRVPQRKRDPGGRVERLRWLALLFAVLLPSVSSAHESRPLYIQVDERENGVVTLRWRTPDSVPVFNAPDVELAGCEPASAAQRGSGLSRRALYTCGSLDGVRVDVHYPVANPSVSALVRVNRISGETHSVLAGPDESEVPLPAGSTLPGVAREYFVLGVEHILLGYDHLLFVACLVLIAGTLRRILVTVTGFTLAHSITLALSALGWVRVPVPPVEAVIALSIVFLATELARPRRDTLTWRHPIAVSASFGLLHGFGFASVLREIGLPQLEVPAALAAFNVGVEVGQIAFVLALVGIFLIGRTAWHRSTEAGSKTAEPLRLLQRPVGYAVGVPAAFWTLERVAGFFG